MTELNGRVAIITGASSGIGAATAKALEKQGVKVVLAGRSHDKLNTVAKDMNEDNIHIVPTDVTKPSRSRCISSKSHRCIWTRGYLRKLCRCHAFIKNHRLSS